MYQLVLSRSFIIGNGKSTRRVLIPIADMFNHKPIPDKNTELDISYANAVLSFNTKSNELIVKSIIDILPGEEVCYNNNSNV